jgi:hypothetical protein
MGWFHHPADGHRRSTSEILFIFGLHMTTPLSAPVPPAIVHTALTNLVLPAHRASTRLVEPHSIEPLLLFAREYKFILALDADKGDILHAIDFTHGLNTSLPRGKRLRVL